MNRIVILALVLTLAMNPPQSDSVNPSSSWGNTAHYLVLRHLAGDRISLVSYQKVELAAPLASLDDLTLQKSLHSDGESYLVRLRTAKGATIYQNVASIPHVLRGEFASTGPNEMIDGHSFSLTESVFVVRVPWIPHTRLELMDNNLKSLAEFNLDSLSTAQVDQTESPDITVYPIQVTGNPANRLDMVILGDGYTAAEQNKFANDASGVYSSFFNIAPLTQYINFYNIYAIHSSSNQSGADHPLYNPTCVAGDLSCCADAAMQTDPLNGQFKDTIFDSTYCYYNIHRLLVAVDYTMIYTVAAAVPDWDTIMVMVNDTTYGGSGGATAVFSIHSAAVEIAKHEFGHSFGRLADEYDYGTPGICDDLDSNPNNNCRSNITNATAREQIKWNYWILPTTPIPTPENGSYINDVGLFQGAFYDPVNYYRSGDNCLMRNLNRPFCQVPSQTMVLRLYQGGWGVPSAGISLIEPGSTLPTSPNVSMSPGDTQTFSATLLQPLVPVSISWLVDSVVQAGQTSSTFLFTRLAAGSYTIILRVQDVGSFVHPTAAGSSLTFEHTWNVTVDSRLFLPAIGK